MACINPNTPEFKAALEKAGGNPMLAEIELSKSLEIKPGVTELFESNPELANVVYSKILTNSGLSAENLLSFLLKDNLIEKQC